jgi:hypothetical protein
MPLKAKTGSRLSHDPFYQQIAKETNYDLGHLDGTYQNWYKTRKMKFMKLKSH